MTEQQFSQNVRHLEYQGKHIYLVGTAHISQKSVEEVNYVIDTLKPDTVCVELDQLRYETLVDDQRFRKLDLFQIIREKKVLFVMANWCSRPISGGSVLCLV
ncbi:MAG: TraB/GumN family protein [Myxococcales bacterium]|nr:MAG: TraB/GumN family protein [Myxococcales bacterium]